MPQFFNVVGCNEKSQSCDSTFCHIPAVALKKVIHVEGGDFNHRWSQKTFVPSVRKSMNESR